MITASITGTSKYGPRINLVQIFLQNNIELVDRINKSIDFLVIAPSAGYGKLNFAKVNKIPVITDYEIIETFKDYSLAGWSLRRTLESLLAEAGFSVDDFIRYDINNLTKEKKIEIVENKINKRNIFGGIDDW